MAENKTTEEVKQSIGNIYSDLLRRRSEKREIEKAKKAEKRAEKEAEESEEAPKTKKEKRERDLASWEEIIVGLTGDDLEYVAPKKSKKKYRKWIGDDVDEGLNLLLSNTKPKKKKKRNYNKEFEPELNILKSVLTDQNKFTADLLKRYQIMAGPNTKDSAPLNKNQVDLASVINASRSNSLGLLREIGNLKKTIADLYMKQKKLDSDLGGDGNQTNDLGLMGSNIMDSMFGNSISSPGQQPDNIMSLANQYVPNTSAQVSAPESSNEMRFPKFDPETWDGAGLDANATAFEAIPHTVLVEYNKSLEQGRFMAIRDDTKEELVGAPLPTCRIKSFDVENELAKDEFDQVYKLKIIE